MKSPGSLIGFLTIVLAALGAFQGALGAPVILDAERRSQLSALELIRGETYAAGDLAGKAVVVTFFASWCPPCRTEFLHLNDLTRDYSSAELAIMAVNVFEEFDGNDESRMRRFLDDTRPTFAVVKGTEKTKHAFGDVQRIPTVLIFDRRGRPVMHFIHARGAEKTTASEDELRTAIDEALERRP